MTEDGMTCQEVLELLTEYLEAALPLPVQARLEEHLDGCPPCRRYLHQLRATIRLAGSLREEEVPAEVREQLLALFRSWRP